ncbi:MAG: alpha/beta fold hydrolase [Planctomycetaceae bacterium]|jgi:alpha-beta hydrolase superfamily lysophospholipase
MNLIVAVAALLLIPGLIVTWFGAGSFVAARPQSVGDPPADLPATPISLNSESGSRLAGWHLRSADHRGVVVLLHPYQGCRLTMVDRARFLHSKGYSSVMIDLQAHGESPGERVTIGYRERHDARAAVEFARTEHPHEPIAVIGFSMGGAAALLASPLNVDAMVLESVYPDIETAVKNRVVVKLGAFATLPARLLLMQFRPRLGISLADMRPIQHLPDVGCPVFIMSGTVDRHTTEADTRAMFKAAAEPKQLWLLDGADHEDLYDFNPQEYETRLLEFFEQHLITAGSTLPTRHVVSERSVS